MSFNSDHSVISSFIFKKKIEITKADFDIFLNLRTEGLRAHTLTTTSFDWTEVNRVIRDKRIKDHLPKVSTLARDARIIQHVLRTFIMPKAGDRVNITPLLSTVTYLIMTRQPIDEAQLLIDYIYGLSKSGHVNHKRKKNIALGHLIAYILEKKYNLIHLEQDFEEPLYYNDASFRAIFNKDEPSKTHVVLSETEEEAEPSHAAGPNYQDLIQRFDNLEAHFDQRFDQIETHLQQQDIQYNQDMGFMRDQINAINSNMFMMSGYFNFFGSTPSPPPPDQGPSE
ncbi:hypothetical protein MA16_Dca028503 [Dendrobium catenatum]|uniref:Uncharacterized protein n=1 Tax=Dendrobium catenatum TaxID=906689 RepID=A0A2I0V730_9ASPA|nr:hypothetical protein MA16_Dca028503 [Dendrobium catenatum]